MGRFSQFACVVLVALSAAACQSSRPSIEQTGPASDVTSPVKTTSPTDQNRGIIVAPVVVVAGQPGAAAGEMPSISIVIGPHADGDVKGQGQRADGSQSDEKTTTQTNAPSQSNDLSGAVKAATDFLATVDPTSAAGKLAKSALDAANVRNLDESKRLLAAAKIAPTTPGSGGNQ